MRKSNEWMAFLPEIAMIVEIIAIEAAI